MGKLIAISGKGGVGKTTIAGLMVIRLITRGCKPVLAIDADPNTCLDAALDVHLKKTVGGVREEAREMGIRYFMPKPLDLRELGTVLMELTASVPIS